MVPFKGPNARKILKIAHKLVEDRSLPRDLTVFAHALVKFDAIVTGCFGIEMGASFNFTFPSDIDAFEKAFMKLGISVTPKCHAIFVHLPKWLSLNKGPLGRHSEQATEACHYDFLPILANYASNPLKIQQVGEQTLSAVAKYNWLHLKDPSM